jgi:hypothetical protein
VEKVKLPPVNIKSKTTNLSTSNKSTSDLRNNKKQSDHKLN